MNSMSPYDIKITMAIGIFLMGVITFWIGVAILVFKTAGRDQQIIAAQTARLAQKGLAEEISGLVGNASSLLNALNEMVRTTAGIGIFLIAIGLVLMGSAIWFVLQIY
ncbi:MAG: hypothetical protein EHM70_00875 [Chloroflexota bacterium]|nr:MAG: hypothetical protein EHM70_00875 [Chloroflexota bacterium]